MCLDTAGTALLERLLALLRSGTRQEFRSVVVDLHSEILGEFRYVEILGEFRNVEILGEFRYPSQTRRRAK